MLNGIFPTPFALLKIIKPCYHMICLNKTNINIKFRKNPKLIGALHYACTTLKKKTLDILPIYFIRLPLGTLFINTMSFRVENLC